MKEVSHGSDGNISLENLEKCINSDLANNYGNLCQRIFSFIKNNCNNTVSRNNKLSDKDKKIIYETKNLTESLPELMDNQNLNFYIKKVIDISFITNKYINDEEPWKLKISNREKMNNILHVALEQIGIISILLNPIIPTSSSKVLEALNIDKDSRNLSFLNDKNILPNEVKIKNLDILFNKINS